MSSQVRISIQESQGIVYTVILNTSELCGFYKTTPYQLQQTIRSILCISGFVNHDQLIYLKGIFSSQEIIKVIESSKEDHRVLAPSNV
jgi:hypothetical protein